MLGMFDNSRIQNRYTMRPLRWYGEGHDLSECNRIYQEEGLELAANAARHCLSVSGTRPEEVDHIVFVSSTGHATPTLDARLIRALKLRSTTSRVPIWGLGCAGGASGLARATEHALAYPRHRVLLVTLECCSLTFVAGDHSKKNVVATALFGDGAAAALVTGDLVPGDGPKVVAARSFLIPDTERIMGWDFMDDGMRLVLSPRLPALVKRELPGLVRAFLEHEGLQHKQIAHYITHPGGAHVLDAYAEALHLAPEDLRHSEEVLRQCGNVSSVTILLVLERWLAQLRKAHRPHHAARAEHALASAFGPGFSAEMLLLQV